jgi:hypothetical protein
VPAIGTRSEFRKQTHDRPPGKGSVFSEEAENGTFRPPVASKQTKQIFFKNKLKKWLKIALK